MFGEAGTTSPVKWAGGKTRRKLALNDIFGEIQHSAFLEQKTALTIFLNMKCRKWHCGHNGANAS
jgi:hypothetical protein